MTPVRRTFALLAMALAAGPRIVAQDDPEIERLRREVEALRQENREMRRDLDRALGEIDAFRGRAAEDPAARTREIESAVDRYLEAKEGPSGGEDWFDESLTALFGNEEEKGLLELHGRLTGGYAWFDSARNVDGANPNSFDQSDFALWIGYEPEDWLHAIFEVEYQTGGSELEVDQARLTFDVLDRERLSVTAGKFYYPFGIERLSYSSVTNKLVDRPAPFRRIVPGTYSDVGVMVSGRFHPDEESPSYGYEFAVTNGLAGPEPGDVQVLDDNDEKQLGGRLALSPFSGLEFGASSLWGRYDDRDDLALWLVGGDVRFTYDGVKFLEATTQEVLDLRGEFLQGDVQAREAFPGSGTTWYRRRGSYAQAAYRTVYEMPALEYLEYVIRADYLEEDDRSRDFRDAWRLAGGVGWSFHRNFRLKVEYVRSFEIDGPQIDNDGLLLEISANW